MEIIEKIKAKLSAITFANQKKILVRSKKNKKRYQCPRCNSSDGLDISHEDYFLCWAKCAPAGKKAARLDVIDLAQSFWRCDKTTAIANLASELAIENNGSELAPPLPEEISLAKKIDVKTSPTWQEVLKLAKTPQEEELEKWLTARNFGKHLPNALKLAVNCNIRIYYNHLYNVANLVFPTIDDNGTVVGCHLFGMPDGKKFKGLAGESNGSSIYPLIVDPKSHRITIVEAVTNAFSLGSVGENTIACFSKNNLPRAIEIAKKLYPDKRIIVWLDDDAATYQKNTAHTHGVEFITWDRRQITQLCNQLQEKERKKKIEGFDQNDLIELANEDFAEIVTNYLAKTQAPRETKEPQAPQAQPKPATKKTEFFETEDKKTFRQYIKKQKDGAEEEKTELFCDFVMKLVEQVEDENGKVSWKISLESAYDKKTLVIESGQSLTNLSEFANVVGNAGLFTVSNTNKTAHNNFLHHVYSKSNPDKKKKICYFGRTDSDRKEFVYANAIAVAGGRKELGEILPTTTKQTKNFRLGEMPQDLNKTWHNILNKIFSCYGGEAQKIIGFSAMSIFAREIEESFGFVPILFLNGGKGTGKSTIYNIIARMFGCYTAIKPCNFGATTVGIWRTVAQLQGVPICLNEYAGDKKANHLISSLYDREGYIRGKKTNDLQTDSVPVNATFVIASTRQIAGYESEAVTSRLVTVDTNNFVDNRQTKKQVVTVLESNEFLSSFVPFALQIDQQKAISEAKRYSLEFRQSGEIEPRTADNLAIIRAFSDAVANLLGFDCLSYGETDASNYWQNEVEERQKGVNGQNYARTFLQVLQSEMAKNNSQISHEIASYSGEELIFNLKLTHPILARLMPTLPDKITIARELKAIGAQNVTERIMGKPEKVWKILKCNID